MTSVQTALSSHSACFICRERHRSLHRIKKKDVIHAYKSHKIYIKHHARVCDAHFDDDGLIRKEEFSAIPTKNIIYSQDTIKMFDTLCQTNESLFDQFRNIKNLEEEHCMKITNLTKRQFFEFSEFIETVYDTKHRTKHQLTALYLFWLKTGNTQKNLALSFGNFSKQRQISRFLNQIRFAIHKEFVPIFLGAQNDREFYLRFNTLMTQNIFELDPDVLVLVADGTYCKIQKSNNNDFQYKTYSGQKKDSLFKPFIICCADGYIIDCYGPFAANDNDSKILNYIIETDEELRKLLLPNKTMFLIDRGFRDSYHILSEKELNPKIPTCSQLEEINEKQLTVEQSNKSRLCRFIIEKKIGEIKKFKALDNRLNSEINHLQFDYRNACAIINFKHKSCCADEEKAFEIGEKIKNKINNSHTNYLDQLKNVQLATKKNPPIPFEDLTDFPILSEEELQDEIFLGSYYLKQSKSYFSDIIKNGVFCKITKELLTSYASFEEQSLKNIIERLKTFQIIGMQITSRHLRSVKRKSAADNEKSNSEEEAEIELKKYRTKYKVFIEYEKDKNTPSAFKDNFKIFFCL